MNSRFLQFGLVIVVCASTVNAGRTSRVHEIAHFGDGGGIQTAFLLSNDNAEEANATIRFFADDGSELQLTIGGTTASSFSLKVPANGTARFITEGNSDPLKSGWALIASSRNLGVQALFEIRSGGTLVTQAAVEPSGALLRVLAFVDQSAVSNTGIAIANVLEQSIRVVLTLRRETGELVGSAQLILPPLGKRAAFLSDLFDQVGDVRGSLLIEGSGRFSVVALQQTGLVLGTLPPIF